MNRHLNLEKFISKKNKKKSSQEKKVSNNIKNLNNNFWDIEMDVDEINNFNNKSLDKNPIKDNIVNNNFQNISNEKEKVFSFYDRYKNLIKTENLEKYANISNGKITLIPYNKEQKNTNKNDKRNNSVDINRLNREKKKITKKKIVNFDELSVFKRNRKWLDSKNEKLSQELKKYINKKEEEIKNIKDYKINTNTSKDLNKYFNEEVDVAQRPENYRYFMRLIQTRQDRERSLDYISGKKINCLKTSHYSGRPDGITPNQMRKYIKKIHNELKDINNQN